MAPEIDRHRGAGSSPASAPLLAGLSGPGEEVVFSYPLRREPLPRLERILVHNHVVRAIRELLGREGYVEIPLPELTAATGASELGDSMFSLDYFGGLAFPRQTGQLHLEEFVAQGVEAVWCEGESLRREPRVDGRHLTAFKLIEIERRGLSLEGLCAVQERILKHAASLLHVDQIGGDNVTRLDRVILSEHPRLSYREALRILNRRGFALRFGDDLDREAEDMLVHHCGNLPVHVTHWPESLKSFTMKLDRDDPQVVECVDYVLPYSGETFGGSVRETDPGIMRRRLERGTAYGRLRARAREAARARCRAAGVADRTVADDLAAAYRRQIEAAFDRYLGLFEHACVERAGCGLGVARLLQFFMGLESVKDAIAFPLDRTSFGGRERGLEAVH